MSPVSVGSLGFVPLAAAHWVDVARIYRQGIKTGQGTFEPDSPATWEDFMRPRHAGLCRAAVGPEGGVVGFATLAAVSSRPVYAGVAEVGIYIAEEARGQGIGSALLAELIAVSESAGLWTLQASIFPENTASVALHAKHGFRLVGRRERIGRMRSGPLEGQWRDTILLERRSPVVGLASL